MKTEKRQRTAEEWRTQAVAEYGAASPAVAWLDKLIAEGNGEPMAADDPLIEHLLLELDAGEVEVE